MANTAKHSDNTSVIGDTTTAAITAGPSVSSVSELGRKADAILAANNISTPFVNAFDIAAAEGIAIKYRKFQPKDQAVAGFYFSKDNTIYLNADEPAVRQLFTVAHELGHYFLGHQPDEYGVYQRRSVTNGTKSAVEAEADSFAAHLLMPESMIQAEFNKHPFLKTMGPSFMALKFGVSTVAMARRLTELGYNK